MITDAEPNVMRQAVEARVRDEHEPIIQAEIDRRLAAVEAALAGKTQAPPPPPPPRRPRSDKGVSRRLGGSPLQGSPAPAVEASAEPVAAVNPVGA